LDEATSSLDPKIESKIIENILSNKGSKTIILITHRLHLSKNADQIIVMDNGRIIENGDHKELIQNQGLYQKLSSIVQESESVN